MSRKDVLKQFANPARSMGDHEKWVKANAHTFAQQWKEDCYVYGAFHGVIGSVIYTPGPDADHPKTTPTYIAKYNAPAKKARIGS